MGEMTTTAGGARARLRAADPSSDGTGLPPPREHEKPNGSCVPRHTGNREGRGRRGREWKPFFHGAVAIALSELDLPFIFAIDGNEPKEETLETVTFHWEEGRSGVKKFASLLGREPIHRARDILRQTMERSGAARASETVAVTYDTGGETGQRRLDSIWATEEFEIEDFQAH